MSELYIYPSENDYESDYSDNMNEFDKYEYKYDTENNRINENKTELKIDKILEVNDKNINYDYNMYYNGKIILVNCDGCIERYMKYKTFTSYSLFIWVGDNNKNIERFICIETNKIELDVENTFNYNEFYNKTNKQPDIEIDWSVV